MRNNYLSKLAYSKTWMSPDKRPKTHQTCIIFDWDDTILCTSFIAPYSALLHDKTAELPEAVAEPLQKLDDIAVRLLQLAKTLGTVMIITNAAEGWVEMSAERFMPKVFQEI